MMIWDFTLEVVGYANLQHNKAQQAGQGTTYHLRSKSSREKTVVEGYIYSTVRSTAVEEVGVIISHYLKC